MTKKTVRAVFDARLSGIQITGKQRNAIMERIEKEEAPVKRKISTSILIAALMIALLSATAFAAVSLYRSAESGAIQQARQALFEKYGLTPPTLGLFLADASYQGGGWNVTFMPFAGDVFDKGRMGEYAVTLTEGKASAVEWTHDAADPALWRDRGLEAPAWGQNQLLLALGQKQEADAAHAAAHVGVDKGEAPGLPMEEGMADAAKQALMEQYGFTDATLTLFSAKAIASETSEDGYIDVIYTPDDTKSLGMIGEKMGRYYVTLNPASGEVVKVNWSEDSVWEDKAYTQSDWGSAPAYHAKLLPWMLELFDAVDQIAKPYGLNGPDSMTVYDLGAEDKGAHDQLFRDAGFLPKDGYYRTIPGKNDISYEEALKIARQVLMQDMALTEAQLDAGKFDGEHFPYQDDMAVFFFFFYPAQGPEHYSVLMDARTGEVQHVDVIAGGNG